MSSAANPEQRRDTASTPATSSQDTAGPSATQPTQSVVDQQRQRFGGMKFGACFFGWLAATGLAVLLISLLAAFGAGVGQNLGADPNQAAQNPTNAAVVAIVLLAVVFIAYFAGGYVAGRMARFSGAKQGLGVWLWAIVIAIVLAIVAAIAGTRSNLWAGLQGLPQIPVSGDTLTTGAVLTAVGVAVVSLVGAVLGGLAGMRYHRKIDKTGSHLNLTRPTG